MSKRGSVVDLTKFGSVYCVPVQSFETSSSKTTFTETSIDVLEAQLLTSQFIHYLKKHCVEAQKNILLHFKKCSTFDYFQKQSLNDYFQEPPKGLKNNRIESLNISYYEILKGLRNKLNMAFMKEFFEKYEKMFFLN